MWERAKRLREDWQISSRKRSKVIWKEITLCYTHGKFMKRCLAVLADSWPWFFLYIRLIKAASRRVYMAAIATSLPSLAFPLYVLPVVGEAKLLPAVEQTGMRLMDLHLLTEWFVACGRFTEDRSFQAFATSFLRDSDSFTVRYLSRIEE